MSEILIDSIAIQKKVKITAVFPRSNPNALWKVGPKNNHRYWVMIRCVLILA